MCSEHWRRVPVALRREVIDAAHATGKPSAFLSKATKRDRIVHYRLASAAAIDAASGDSDEVPS